ncbi:MAG: MATE family efflux transporter [Cellvibrionaceae bacterium]
MKTTSQTPVTPASNSIRATLTTGSVSQHLISMSWPMIWGILATMSFNAADTWFVTRLGDLSMDSVEDAALGDLALAAMGYTFPVVMIITSIAIGLGAGASSAIARAMGGGNKNRVSRLATDSVTLATIISVAVSIAGWLSIDWVFVGLLNATEDTMPLIREYMSIWYLSAPLLLVPMIVLSALRALGFASIQGVLMIVGAFINIILDPFLIFGWWGLPRLGLEGAAYATLISRLFTLVVAFYYLQGRMHVLTSPFAALSEIKSSWYSLFHIGIPSMISNLIIPVSSLIIFAAVSYLYGEQAVAGLGVALRIEPIALIVFYALSAVVGPLFGQNQGAGLYDRLFEGLSVVTRFCFLFGIALAVLLWIFGALFAGLFSDSEEILSVAVKYLMIVPISYGAYGLVMSVIAMFNGLGMPFQSLTVSFLRVLGLYLPIAFVSNCIWGLTGLIIATAISNLLVGLIAYYWLKRALTKEKSLQI